MVGTVCSVVTCKCTFNGAKAKGERVAFYTFPKDPHVRKEWMRRCGRKPETFTSEFRRICSKHFKPDDYEDEMRAKLLGYCPRKLKKEAIPSLNIPFGPKPPSPEKLAQIRRREERASRRERKVLVDKLLEASCSDKAEQERAVRNERKVATVELNATKNCDKVGQDKIPRVEDQPSNEPHQSGLCLIRIPGVRPFVTLLRGEPHQSEVTPEVTPELEIDGLKNEVDSLKKEVEELKQKLVTRMKCESTLLAKVSVLENQLKEAGANFQEKACEVFKDFLSVNQVEMAMKNKTKARWTQDELSRAFTKLYLSRRCYMYLRNKLNYPLPGLSTIVRWATNINVRRGHLTDVLAIMNAIREGLSDLERVTIIGFSEMKVSSMYEYDQKIDEVVGPHEYMLVVMARGLFGKWKQPVYIDFDQKMTKNILEDIVTKLHNNGYSVVGYVSDCGVANQELWKEMIVGVDSTSSPHPVTGEPIYVFADAPHLLKLMRNWFLDTGFSTMYGDIDKEMIVKLIDCLVTKNKRNDQTEETRNDKTEKRGNSKTKGKDKTERKKRSCCQLTKLHVECDNVRRQNLNLVAQLFSHSTATALIRYLPHENIVKVVRTSEFVQLVNDWFDIMNSYRPTASAATKRPFSNSEIQREKLKNMADIIESMRCVGETTLQIFQRGILMSLKSLEELFSRMKTKFKVSSILTYRLNQDCLENLFSEILTRGDLDEHPSPLNAMQRIRMVLLGKNPGIVQFPSTVESAMVEEYLITNALKKAKIRLGDGCEGIQPEPVSEDFVTASSNAGSSVREQDGLDYIAGYLAKKHYKTYPHLVRHTYHTEQGDFHSYAMPSWGERRRTTWVQSISNGELLEPSAEWDSQVKEMDQYFTNFHQNTFSGKMSVVDNSVKYISKEMPDVPLEIVNSFCKLRVLLRIKYLNLKNEVPKSMKRNNISNDREITKKTKC